MTGTTPALRRRGLLATLPGLAAACALALPGAASAQPVRRVPGSLAGQPSTFAPATAPDSVLRPADTAGGLQPRTPTSSFTPAQGPETSFRLAEVPPARVEATRSLLTALHARHTPEQAIVVDLPADVLFDFDRAELRPDARPALAQAAELLQSYPRAPVRVDGHSDGKGSDGYNDALSLRRAQAVARALEPGAGGRRLAVRGHGKREPVAAETRLDGSDDPAGRQRNRRVAIVIDPLPPR